MTREDIARMRLSAQHITQSDFTTAEDVVRHLLALQAQDYPGALWSIALRSQNLTQRDVEQAIADRKIIRTWPMRGTLHFVAAEDARWMVNLLAPRAVASAAGRRKILEIDDDVLAKSQEVISNALAGGKSLTRNALCDVLDQHGISTAGQRGIHIIHYFAEQTLLCFGPHEDKQPTFVLMDEWIAPTPPRQKDEALAELAKRYFTSHGPASLKDFAGWSFMTMGNAKLGLELAKVSLISETVDGIEYWFSSQLTSAPIQTYLLPGFDEFILGYKDRSASLAEMHSQHIVPGNNGMFLPTLVIDGQILGTWKRVTHVNSQRLTILPFESLTKTQEESIDQAIRRYERYAGLTTDWVIAER
ncbi:MAG TPA: winged helix DNA-binding domain-containing protein [Candidatus Chromulinivoraceae bacterium]|nr:winged helix DNA-binding domain-containing protein [Candidatus Chromulinivoraceae bacterium]